MDVGQILGMTTEPPRRDNETRREDGEEFTNYLNEPTPKSDPPAKKEAAEPAAVEAPAKEPANNQQATPEKTAQNEDAPETGKAAETAPAGKSTKIEGTPVVPKGTEETSSASAATIPVLPAPPVSEAAVEVTSLKKSEPAPAASPVGSAAQHLLNEAGAGEEASLTAATAKAGSAVAETVKKPETIGNETRKAEGAVAQVGVPAAASTQTDTSKAPKVNAATVAAGNEKTAAAAATETMPAPAQSQTLDVVRAEAAAKMSEKDVLSAKIAEMLQDGKGKISLIATKQQQSFQSALASSTNLVTASMTNNPAASGMNAVPFASADVESATPQAMQSISTGAHGVSADGTNPSMPAVPTGSVQGVDATAANNASQAANAARASTHLPVAEQISTHLSTAIKEGHDRIKINLHPSELGRVEVKLDIGHDGRVLAVVSVDKQETLDLLQRDARSLERALQDAGFDTGSNSLNFGLRQNGQDGQGEGRNFANFDVPADGASSADMMHELSLPGVTGGINADGGLDIQV